MTPEGVHPSIDDLADLAEGLLDSASAAATQAHLATCAACRDTAAQLRGVTARLRELPTELPTPHLVSARITAALAAERGTTTSGTPTPPESASLSPRRASRAQAAANVAWFRRRVPQALAAAASVAVIGLASYTVVTDNDSDGSETSAANQMTDTTAADTYEEMRPRNEPSAAAGGSTVVPDALSSQVTEVWRNRTEVAADCGQPLADDLGLPLVGSVETTNGILVVVENSAAQRLDGWNVNDCAVSSAKPLTPTISIPIP